MMITKLDREIAKINGRVILSKERDYSSELKVCMNRKPEKETANTTISTTYRRSRYYNEEF